MLSVKLLLLKTATLARTRRVKAYFLDGRLSTRIIDGRRHAHLEHRSYLSAMTTTTPRVKCSQKLQLSAKNITFSIEKYELNPMDRPREKHFNYRPLRSARGSFALSLPYATNSTNSLTQHISLFASLRYVAYIYSFHLFS